MVVVLPYFTNHASTYSLHLLQAQSFQSTFATLSSGNRRLTSVNIYSSLSSHSDFIPEFQSLLEFLVSGPPERVITRESRLQHRDALDNSSLMFQYLISGFNLKQHISFFTHDVSHTNDLMTRSSSSVVKSYSICSRHYLITLSLLVLSGFLSSQATDHPHTLSLAVALGKRSTF